MKHSLQSKPNVQGLRDSVIATSFVNSISGLVVEYIVAIDVTRVRFPADAYACGSPLFCSRESHVRCRSMACLLYLCPERGALLVGGFVPRPGRMTLATWRWARHCWRAAGPSSNLASPRYLAHSWVPRALCTPVASARCV